MNRGLFGKVPLRQRGLTSSAPSSVSAARLKPARCFSGTAASAWDRCDASLLDSSPEIPLSQPAPVGDVTPSACCDRLSVLFAIFSQKFKRPSILVDLRIFVLPADALWPLSSPDDQHFLQELTSPSASLFSPKAFLIFLLFWGTSRDKGV